MNDIFRKLNTTGKKDENKVKELAIQLDVFFTDHNPTEKHQVEKIQQTILSGEIDTLKIRFQKYLKNVLIIDGMSNDKIVFITDAKKEDIEEWCNDYISSLENGINIYLKPLEEKHYVEILFDSEINLLDDFDDDANYDFVFDLQYYPRNS